MRIKDQQPEVKRGENQYSLIISNFQIALTTCSNPSAGPSVPLRPDSLPSRAVHSHGTAPGD